jgi:hypothetical protein
MLYRMKKLNKTLIIKIAIAIILATGQPFFLMGCFFMKEIQLTQGKVALVDDSDFEWLNQWKWHAWCPNKNNKVFYAKRTSQGILMHRVIMQAVVGELIDHGNQDGLDNRRNNLRKCTRGQNSMNRRSKEKSSSKFLGVCFDKVTKRWMVQIDHNRKHYFGGRFKTEVEAAKAYNKKATELHGEFANLNKV